MLVRTHLFYLSYQSGFAPDWTHFSQSISTSALMVLSMIQFLLKQSGFRSRFLAPATSYSQRNVAGQIECWNGVYSLSFVSQSTYWCSFVQYSIIDCHLSNSSFCFRSALSIVPKYGLIISTELKLPFLVNHVDGKLILRTLKLPMSLSMSYLQSECLLLRLTVGYSFVSTWVEGFFFRFASLC